MFAWGIYLDESGCGNDVYGNIVERCQIGAMHLHNARENHIYNNIFAHHAGPQGETHQLSLQTWNNSPSGVFLRDRQPNADTHSVVADPLFVDAEHGDFTLKPESPALKLGFEPIPFRDIGPYQGDARATWPIREAEGARESPHWLQSVPIDKP